MNADYPTDLQLSHSDIEQVLSTIDIPACPAMAQEALAEAQKDAPDLNRLARSITADPALSAAALKLANSALYGSGGISSVPKAIERLGTNNVVCVIVSVALRSSITGLPAAELERFWNRVLLSSTAAALIARRHYGISPDAAYTYTLFHDAGIPLMMRRFPAYGEVLVKARESGEPLAKAEASYFPCTHPVIGMLLTRNWGLPRVLGQAIRFHHEPDLYALPPKTLPNECRALIAVAQVAEQIVDEFATDGALEVADTLFPKALDYLGITDTELDELRDRIESSIA